MSKPIQEALAIVRDAKAKVNELLQEADTINNLLGLNSLFKQIENRLSFMGGIIEADPYASEPIKFPPITNFMGEEIKMAEATTMAELNPDEAKKKAFTDKVKRLYDTIEAIGANTIVSSYVIPDDILVLRAVAKWAKMKDYRDRKISAEFVNDIIEGIKARKEDKLTQDKIDDNSKDIKEEKVLTKADIDANPNLQKWKAEPGDTLLIRNDGKQKLVKAKPAAPKE